MEMIPCEYMTPCEYRAFIDNCLIGSIHDKLYIGDFEIEIIQKQEYDISKLNPARLTKFLDAQIQNTTEIRVRSNPEEFQLTDAKLVVTNLCWLLSFATHSEIRARGEAKVYNNTSEAIVNDSRRRPIRGKTGGNTNFTFVSADEISSYLQQTYIQYNILKDNRTLDAAIHYYVLAERANVPMELRFITLAVLLENLKYTFARNKGYKSDGNNFYEGRNKLYFRTLLTRMFSEVGIKEDESLLSEIVGLRNSVIHQGVLPRDENVNLVEKNIIGQYAKIHCVLQEYFLRLFNYKGQYRSVLGHVKEIR